MALLSIDDDDISGGKVDTGDDRTAAGESEVAEPAIKPELSAEKGRPVVAVSDIEFDQRVYDVQCRLRDLGYFVVGNPDGRLGGATRDAILIFRRNNGLPLSDEVDDAFLAKLAVADKRQVADTRATATAKDIAPQMQTVRASWRQKIVAFIVGIPAAIGGAFSGITSFFKDAYDSIKPLMQPLIDAGANVPGFVWFGGAAVLAFVLWRNANTAEKDTVQKYQEGRLL